LNKHSKQYLTELFNLAVPITITQVGYIITGMADTFFLGRMGVTELAIGTLSVQYHVIFLVLTMGISYALTPLISPLVDKKEKRSDVSSVFRHTLTVSLIFSALLIPLSIFLFPLFCNLFSVGYELYAPSVNFIVILSLSLIPLSVFTTFRMLFESFNDSKSGMKISIRGNVLNIILNVFFIYYFNPFNVEKYYLPAIATLLARFYMAFEFYISALRNEEIKDVMSPFKFKFENKKILHILKIGISISFQFFSEVVAFTVAGFLVASLGKIKLDAHGIALQLASFTYMFGSGISNAACVLSGKYFNQPSYKLYSFRWPVRIVLLVMGFFSVNFLLFRNYLPLIFTEDKEVIKYASQLLIFASVFQFSDGLQVVCSGILRGISIVKFPTYVIGITYFILGIGGSYILGLKYDLDIYGVWFSLTISLIIVALLLYWKCSKIYFGNR
jgi:MATE family multidrug resistance protein